ncbi:unnamed protein product, partial [Ectocarpus fasciculatus]
MEGLHDVIVVPRLMCAPLHRVRSAGPSRNSCLKAISVALNETCDGKRWYTSTKELQL